MPRWCCGAPAASPAWCASGGWHSASCPSGTPRTGSTCSAAPTLQRIAASTEGTHPDAYIYSVVCDEAGCDVMIQEPHLPEAIHSLFERTLADD